MPGVIGRREFALGLGDTVLTWPLGPRAQQPGEMKQPSLIAAREMIE
jgi:hypothetical protein